MAEQNGKIIKQTHVNVQYGILGPILIKKITATLQNLTIENVTYVDEKSNTGNASKPLCIEWYHLMNIDDLNDENSLHSFQVLFKHKLYPIVYIYCQTKQKKLSWINIFRKMCLGIILTKELQTVKLCAVNLGFTQSQIENALIVYHDKYGTMYNVNAFIGTITDINANNIREQQLMNKSLQNTLDHSPKTSELSSGQLTAWSELINMGFDESLSMEAVKMFHNDINECIDFVEVSTQKAPEFEIKEESDNKLLSLHQCIAETMDCEDSNEFIECDEQKLQITQNDVFENGMFFDNMIAYWDKNILNYAIEFSLWFWNKVKKCAMWIWNKSDSSPIGLIKALYYLNQYFKAKTAINKQQYWDQFMYKLGKFLNWLCVAVGVSIGVAVTAPTMCVAPFGGMVGGAIGGVFGCAIEAWCASKVKDPTLKDKMQKHDLCCYLKNIIAGTLSGLVSGIWTVGCVGLCRPSGLFGLLTNGENLYWLHSLMGGTGKEVLSWCKYLWSSIGDIVLFLLGSSIGLGFLQAGIDKFIDWITGKKGQLQ
eukprot:349678_1